MRFLPYFLTILIFISALQAQPPDKRALWVVRDALVSEAEINKVISTAVISGMTDIFVQVRALGYTWYRSHQEPAAPQITGQEFDPLYTVIEKAHRYNIKVHAWVNMFYIWTGTDAPPEINHLFNRAPHLLLRSALSDENSPPDIKELYEQGFTGYFIDPAVEQVRKYHLNLIYEIIDQYQVNGIHLDYFRYPDYKYSISPATRESFRNKYSFDPVSIYADPEAYAKKYGITSFLDKDALYRNECTARLGLYLERIKNHIEETKPDLKLSVAVKADVATAKVKYLQNWAEWLREDLIDFAVMMNYAPEWEPFTERLKNNLVNGLEQRIIVGVSTYNQKARAVRRKLAYLSESDYAGFALFSYNHLVKDERYFNELQLFNGSGGNHGL